MSEHFQIVLGALQEFGILLESDPKLPSVSTLITGEVLRGSWWSHPLSHTIFQVNEQLGDHPEVLITKLISGKVTFVHQHLWAELLAIGSARAKWQVKDLPAASSRLLETVSENGQLRTDELSWPKSVKMKPGDAARNLEKRLLVVASQIHTESGAHAKALESWQHWSKRVGLKAKKVATEEAMNIIEKRLEKLNLQFGANAKLPWSQVVGKFEGFSAD